MLRFLSALFKLAIISLITGMGLSALNLSAADILARAGMTPEKLMILLQRGAEWAVPNIVLGSLVILPIWFVIYLLRPPKG